MFEPIFRFSFNTEVSISMMQPILHYYLANFLIPLCKTDSCVSELSSKALHLLQLSTCGQHWASFLLCSPFLWASLTSLLAFDTDLSSASCLTPSAAGFMIKEEVYWTQICDWSKGSRKLLPSMYVQLLSPSSRLYSRPSPPPHRWWKLWPHPDTHGPAGELFPYRN